MGLVFAAGHDPEQYLSVHAANGARLLDLLGMTGPFACGEEDAEAFLGRVLTALALDPGDPGCPVTTSPGGRWTDGARDPGTLTRHLETLRGIAESARAAGAAVTWG
jgi:hypothetical protein